MKNIRYIFYTIIMAMFIALPAFALADGDDLTGTDSEPEMITIELSNEDDLIEFSNNCKSDAYSSGVVFELKNDITILSESLESIAYFNGTFNGNNYTIKFDEMQTKGSNYGFFRYIGTNGKVKDLNINGNILTDGSEEAIGGLCGVNKGVLDNCSYTGTIDGKSKIGGLCGYNANTGVINQCVNYGKVTSTNYTGGICGYNDGTITMCINKGLVNTEDLETTIDMGDVDLGALNITQNVMTRNDTGGIAGYSSGVIRLSKNYADIGYIHVGYNVGGIVGRQNGVVTICSNYGSVYGRKDVGGIVGQAEPFIESDYLNDKVEQTRDDINTLNNTLNGICSTMSNMSSDTRRYAEDLNDQYKNSMNSLSANLAEISDSIRSDYPEAEQYADNIDEANRNIEQLNLDRAYLQLVDVNKYYEDNGDIPDRFKPYIDGNPGDYDDLNVSIETKIIEEIQYNMDIVNQNLDDTQNLYNNGTGKTTDEFLDSLSSEIENSKSSETVDDMIASIDNGTQQILKGFDSAIDQTNKMMNNISDDLSLLLDEGSDYIEDISSVDTVRNMLGVINYCYNEGTINGDINVAGIAGTMNIEYDADPEYDIDLTNSVNITIRSTVNDVIFYCTNAGKVMSKKDYCGGMAGHQEMGLIYKCQSYGNVLATDGEMLGGIAGYSTSTILECYSFCRLEGEANIGGIVGKGCSVQDCMAICNIVSEGECLGAIAGSISDEGACKSNLFVSDVLQGIDGITYKGIAERRSYDELMDEENVPSGFNMVTVDFMSDGELVSQTKIRYGNKLDIKDYPTIPSKEGYYVEWVDDNQSNGIYNNIIIEAKYISWKKAIASPQNMTIENIDYPIFIVASEFYENTELELTPFNGSLRVDNVDASYIYDWNIIEGDNPGSFDRSKEVEGHFFVGKSARYASLYVKNGDYFEKKDAIVDGSYIVSNLPIGSTFAVVILEPDYTFAYIGCGALLVVVLLILLVIVRKPARTKSEGKMNESGR